HFGNYRIRPGSHGKPDQLVLLDFGAVREFPEKFLRPYFQLHRGAFEKNRQLVEQGANGLGVMSEDDSPELKRDFCDLAFLISEPFDQSTYDWAGTDLPKRVAKLAAQVAVGFKLRPPPREIVFLDRKFGGLYVFLSVLGAHASGRPTLEKYLGPGG